MRFASVETETERRKRVVGRIRQDLLESLADDLAAMAEGGELPEEWLYPRELNRILDDGGYWLSHADPMAPFLAPQACESLLQRALTALASRGSRSWWHEGDRFRANSVDWQTRAHETANRLRCECPGGARTALYGGLDDASVIFGSDRCDADTAARGQITALRRYLRAAGILELAFATSDDGETWVMLVWTKEEALLGKVLFSAWQAGVGAES